MSINNQLYDSIISNNLEDIRILISRELELMKL